jgi:hypothetical protein
MNNRNLGSKNAFIPGLSRLERQRNDKYGCTTRVERGFKKRKIPSDVKFHAEWIL